MWLVTLSREAALPFYVFHTYLVICIHSRKGNTPSYSQINMIPLGNRGLLLKERICTTKSSMKTKMFLDSLPLDRICDFLKISIATNFQIPWCFPNFSGPFQISLIKHKVPWPGRNIFCIPCFFGYKTVSSSLEWLQITRSVLWNFAIIQVLPVLNNPKNLDPSSKSDLDFWDCFWRKNSIF